MTGIICSDCKSEIIDECGIFDSPNGVLCRSCFEETFNFKFKTKDTTVFDRDQYTGTIALVRDELSELRRVIWGSTKFKTKDTTFNIWELQKAERQMEMDFDVFLQKRFGDHTLGCLQLYLDPPQISIQFRKEKSWNDFILEQNGQIICINGTGHPSHAEMIAAIKDFFYKGKTK